MACRTAVGVLFCWLGESLLEFEFPVNYVNVPIQATAQVLCSAYPEGTFPTDADDPQQAKQIADALVKSYVEGTKADNDQEGPGPPGSMPHILEPAEVVFESSGDSDLSPPPYAQFPGNNENPPLVDPLFEHVMTEAPEEKLLSQVETTSTAHGSLVPTTNGTAIQLDKADSDSLVLRELLPDGSKRHPLGYLDPGSLTLTLVIVVAVVFLLSLVGLTFLTIWQYRRRRCSHRWTVGKSKSPAFQSDAWCYENVSDAGTMKKRDSVYLSGATLKPYAYVGSLSISNGTTRSSVFSESTTTHSPYGSEGHRWFDGELHAGCTPYREKLVS